MGIRTSDLDALVAARGAPSNEYAVADVFRDRIEDDVDRIERDSQGNVVAISEGDADLDIALVAHTDELGLLVDGVTDDGFLEYRKLGGHYKGNFPGQRVVVGPDEVTGVIGPKARHYMDDEEQETVAEGALRIDVGARSRQEVEALNIQPGDFATWDREYEHLADDRITGRALDDRIALAILIAVAREVDVDATVEFVATVQEEVGLRGARMTGFARDPDVGIAVEVVPADDYPAAAEDDPDAVLGDGPVVEFADGTSEYLFGGVLVDRETLTWLRTAADGADVDLQQAVMVGGSTDATEYQQVAGGRHAGAIAVPCRYTHSPVETISLNDVDDTVATLVSALATEFPDPDEVRR
jgi:putative aminopeptidase FrvX